MSGEPFGNYILLTESDHQRRVRNIHLKWAGVVAGVLLGAALAIVSIFVFFVI